jgi:hypothetical protein
MTVFYKTAADPPMSEIVWCGARDGRAVTHVVRAPVRPAMWWLCVPVWHEGQRIASGLA